MKIECHPRPIEFGSKMIRLTPEKHGVMTLPSGEGIRIFSFEEPPNRGDCFVLSGRGKSPEAYYVEHISDGYQKVKSEGNFWSADAYPDTPVPIGNDVFQRFFLT